MRLEVGRKHKKNSRIREPEQGKRWVSRPFPARHSLPPWDGVPLEPDDALGQRNFGFPETLPRVVYLVLVPAVAVLKTREGLLYSFCLLSWRQLWSGRRKRGPFAYFDLASAVGRLRKRRGS